jgi:putative Holliday junction resolvase
VSAPIGRTLAVDLGSRRTGLAICDALGIAIRTLAPIVAGSVEEHLDGVLAAAAAEDVERVLLGLPLNMDGSEGTAARAARAFATSLAERGQGLAVELADERLTTVEAAELLAEAGLRRERQRERIDSTAAAVLLRTWIEARRAERAAEEPGAEDAPGADPAAPFPPRGRDRRGRSDERRRPRR